MKTLSILAALLLSVPAHAAADDNVCNADGKNTTLNGKVHTCGTCSSGAQEPTRMWFVGDVSAEKAVAACECSVDKSKCTTSSQKLVDDTKNLKVVAEPIEMPKSTKSIQ